VILNPRTCGERRWRSLEVRLRDVLGDLEVERTRGPLDARRIAREAVRAGVERIVVGGGDGTMSEVVTGLLAAGLGEYAELACLPLGSGCDLPRTLGLSRKPDDVIDGLAAGTSRRVDAGRVLYTDRDGAERTTYFLNITSFGISGLTVELVNQAKKRFGPTAAFALGTLRAISRYEPAEITVRVDGIEVHRGPVNMAAVANGRYFGSGMMVAPSAEVDDGLLELVLVSGLSKPRLVAHFPSIYRGAHFSHPNVSHHRGVKIEADIVSGRALLDVDGEQPGLLPAVVEVRPKAIGLFGQPTAPHLLGAG
jgi:YegS/Rv2252/BmrU family lipid kinase